MVEKTILRHCDNCGASFAIIPSRIKHGRGKHCSPACQYESIRSRPRKNSIVLKCIGCGVKFERYLSIVRSHKGAGKYCTRECRDNHWVGSNTPNWQNGDGVYKRGPRWYAIRRRILRRDKCCQRCGAIGRLHIHHVVPFRMFDCEGEANADSNLVALCPPCHRKEDAKHKWVKIDNGGGALCFMAGSVGWQMAREKGM